jgi:single stranded DNA-binding protein
MQKLTIAGNVGSVRTNTVGQNNTFVLNFTLAVKSDKKGDDGKPLTVWYDCAVWGKFGETMAQYIQKGTSLVCEGTPGAEMYQSNGQTHIKQTCTVKDMTLLGSKPASQQNAAPQQSHQQPNGNAGFQNNPAMQGGMNMNPQQSMGVPGGYNTGFDDDDCPF